MRLASMPLRTVYMVPPLADTLQERVVWEAVEAHSALVVAVGLIRTVLHHQNLARSGLNETGTLLETQGVNASTSLFVAVLLSE